MSAVALLLAVLACAGLAVASLRVSGGAEAVSALPVLIDDDGERPMFAIADLAPGASVSHCIGVTLESGGPSIVALAGAGDATALRDQLRLRIDAGTGGTYAECAGFDGVTAYRGTVDHFLRAHPGGRGLDIWTPAGDGEQRSFRFTVELEDDQTAQGRTASASFTWHARPAAAAPPAPAPAPGAPEVSPPPAEYPPPAPAPGVSPAPPQDEPAPTAGPSFRPSPVPDDVSERPDGIELDRRPPAPEDPGDALGTDLPTAADPGAGVAPRPSAAPAAPSPEAADDAQPPAAAPPTRTSTSRREPSRRRPTDRGDAPSARAGAPRAAVRPDGRGAPDTAADGRRTQERDGLAARLTSAVVDGARAVAGAAAPAAKRAAFPLLLVVLLALFVAGQHRIDARDPKLADAPVHSTPDLPFDPFRQGEPGP